MAIIGAGQSGLGLALALRKHRIVNVALFDKAPRGKCQWNTTARMLIQRTPKQFPGPALEFASLSFRTWYEKQGGNWESVYKIPTLAWAEYLESFRDSLYLAPHYEWSLESIEPEGKWLRLRFSGGRVALARNVVLATGRGGFGGLAIPPFAEMLPRNSWRHTGEMIDPHVFSGKEVCVLGAGASAFDAAAVALENGAKNVRLLMRRAKLPDSNPGADFKGWIAYFSFPDQKKMEMQRKHKELGCLVPPESIARVEKWKNFEIVPNLTVSKASDGDLETSQGRVPFDFLVLGTGYRISLPQVPELAFFRNEILLWEDVYADLPEKFKQYPYLDPYFGFIGKTKHETSQLQNIFCFNYGAFLSHGRIAGDIDVLPIGLNRLAEGIAIRLQN